MPLTRHPRIASLLAGLAAVALTLAAALPALAEFPDRAIKIIVPYPPGGTSDLLARAVAPRLDRKSVV